MSPPPGAGPPPGGANPPPAGTGPPPAGTGPGSPHPAAAWDGLLRRIIELSGEERSLRSVLRRVAELVVDATDADACFVHLATQDGRELVLMGATPAEFDALSGTIRLTLGEGLAGWVAQHGQAALLEDKWSDPRYRYIPALRGEDFSSLASVPMLRPSRTVVGVINVHARHPQHFAPADLDRLGEVARLLAGIVDNAVLYDRLAGREAELERFAARTIELQELDRRRIAGDIHDGISQRLVSAFYHLRAARTAGVSAGALEELDATEALLTAALDEARSAILGLRPSILDDLGLPAAIQSLAATLGGDLEVDLDLQPIQVASHTETALFRIAQEALQNVVKHAQARRVRVALGADGRGVTLEVADDGVGFDPSAGTGSLSYGLRGVAERAALIGARLTVESRVDAGTLLRVRLDSTQPSPAATTQR